MVSAKATKVLPSATCLASFGRARGNAVMAVAPTSGIAPITVSQGKLIAVSAPHQQQRGNQNHDTTQHRQGIRADEAGLYMAHASGGSADESGEAVDETVKTAVIEENQQAREVLAGPHE